MVLVSKSLRIHINHRLLKYAENSVSSFMKHFGKLTFTGDAIAAQVVADSAGAAPRVLRRGEAEL